MYMSGKMRSVISEMQVRIRGKMRLEISDMQVRDETSPRRNVSLKWKDEARDQ